MMTKKLRTYKRSSKLAAALLCLGMLAVPAISRADMLFEENFERVTGENGSISGGAYMPALFGWGWTVELSEDESLNPGNISYPLGSTWNQAEGTVEVVVGRLASPASPGRRNCIFNLTNSSGGQLLSLYIAWQTTFPGDTFVYINGLDALAPVSPNHAVSLGRRFEEGEWLQLVLGWDRDRGEVNLYANGREIEIFQRPLLHGSMTKDISPVPEVVMDSADRGPPAGVVFSALPSTDGGERDSSHMYSAVIDRFRVYDEKLTPDRLVPVGSISHNGSTISGYSGGLVAGDTLEVSIEAEEKGSAAFNIEGVADSVTMTESDETPGVYRGSYTIKYADLAEGASVTGHFVSALGVGSEPLVSADRVSMDGRITIEVEVDDEMLPADGEASTGIRITAKDANGSEIKDHPISIFLSTTDEYTGLVGGGSVEELTGSEVDADWGGITDSFGEVTASYTSGFAAKTILLSARDMVSGDAGTGFVRSFIEGTVDIVVSRPSASALNLAGTLEVELSKDWLTADGRSRSRITAILKDDDGKAVEGHTINFTLYGDNGSLRLIQARTDSRGRAIADYIAGTVMGQVEIAVRDLTSGLSSLVSIELRPDAPAIITLTAEPGEVVTGEEVAIRASVSDINDNPNNQVDVQYSVVSGTGLLSADSVATDSDGEATVTFTGSEPGVVTVKGVVVSRAPADEELSAAAGAVFLYGLDEDPDDLEVIRWLASPGDKVVRGQGLVELEDRSGEIYTAIAPRDGELGPLVAEERDVVSYGQTLGYVLVK
jgi:hypothetical protein